jgi:hypothetical protein
MKHFLLLATVVAEGLRSNAVQAQVRVSIGPQLGVNVSSTPYATYYRPDGVHTTARTGIEVGAVASIGWGHWALQPALLFSQKGFNMNDEYTDEYTISGVPGNYSSTYSTTAEYCFNYLTCRSTWCTPNGPTAKASGYLPAPT